MDGVNFTVRCRNSFHFVSESVNTHKQLVDMIQLVDSIHGTLFANVEVNHVVTMFACECKNPYSTIFYETQA